MVSKKKNLPVPPAAWTAHHFKPKRHVRRISFEFKLVDDAKLTMSSSQRFQNAIMNFKILEKARKYFSESNVQTWKNSDFKLALQVVAPTSVSQ